MALGTEWVAPFHWELEFPEVFTTDDGGNVGGGFDVIVGNPPFAGKNTLIHAHADEYLAWLQMIHPESHGNSDLVAHFYRRAFVLLRAGGSFGLIATNTIGQGDTRSRDSDGYPMHGTIYSSREAVFKWPGEAAVIVSVIHVLERADRRPLLPQWAVQSLEYSSYLFAAGGGGAIRHI